VDGQLVTRDSQSMGFPQVPGVPLPDGMINPFYHHDFGPQFNYRDLSGVITRQPPTIKSVLPMLVPKVNADGNETSGVPSALHQAPLGIYVGWNVHADGFYQGQGKGYFGGYIPFAIQRRSDWPNLIRASRCKNATAITTATSPRSKRRFKEWSLLAFSSRKTARDSSSRPRKATF
jgi:hypothetical protein